MLWWSDGPAKPQRRNTERAELKADMSDVDVAERGIFLLSLSNPKNEQEIMPGTLNSVISSVEDVAEREATE